MRLVSIALLGAAVALHTAVFTAVDVVLLRPLPFPDPDRLVVVSERKLTPSAPAVDTDELSTLANFQYFARSAPPFAALGAYASADPALFAGDAPRSYEQVRVTTSLFQALGTPPQRGRLFAADEDQAGAAVAILTDSAWTRDFGRAESVVGSRIDLDGVPHTVIGIASPEAERLLRADVLRPFPRLQEGRGQRVLHLVGRLADGVGVAAAREAMTQRVAAIESVARENNGIRAASVDSLQERMTAGLRAPILALDVLALFIILVVAANLVGLRVARLERGARELAIRSALGASRGRLVRDAVIDSLAIAGVACAIGVIGAFWLLAMAKATLIAPGVMQPLQLDARAIAAAASVALIVGIGAGTCSVLMLLVRDLAPLLHRATTAVGPGRVTQRAQALVVITQTALALIFIVVSFTLIGEVARLMRIDPGFRTDSLWTVDLKTVGGAHVEQGVQARQYAGMLEALRALPGVRAAGAISSFPLLGLPGSLALRVRDAQVPPGERVQFRLAMPGYFEAMGIAVREGRDFAVSDDRSKGTAALVAIVNRAFVDRYLPGANPIGRDVGVMTSPWIHVIGVVDNVRSVDLTKPPVPELYVSPLQVSSSGEMTLALRTLPGITLTASTVRAAIAQVAPGVAVTSMGALDARLAEQRRPQRFSTAFLTLLAILTMSLAAASTYSLVSYAVSSRAREIAIRRVLGAEERLIARRMLAHAGGWIAIGATGGIVVLMLIARTSPRVLLGSHTIDPLTVGVAAMILILITLFASLMPVRRAIDRPLREVLQTD